MWAREQPTIQDAAVRVTSYPSLGRHWVSSRDQALLRLDSHSVITYFDGAPPKQVPLHSIVPRADYFSDMQSRNALPLGGRLLAG